MDYRKPAMLSQEEWRRGYDLWLRSGYTLEQVGRHLGLRPNSGRSVSTYLNKYFGRGATDPIANSFVRSMAEDYPGEPWVAGLEPEDNRGSGRFMTISVERGLATKGTAKLVGNRSNEMKYRIAYQQSLRQSYDPWEQFEPKPYSLLMFTLVFNAIIPLLELLLRGQNSGGIQLQSNVITSD